MDLDIITKIAAAGAMGVSIFLIYKVYNLLKCEQEKETPRPDILKSIYIFMGFAVVMTLLSLGIEYARHYMDADDSKNQTSALLEKLNSVAEKKYFSVNKNGNPEPIKIKYDSIHLTLSDPFPKNSFENNLLTLKKTEEEKYLAVKNNNGDEIVFGHIEKGEIKSKAQELIPLKEEKKFNPKDLITLGVSYSSPATINEVLDYKINEDKYRAVEHLIELISQENGDKKLQEHALKLLTQSYYTRVLNPDQYLTLIEVLDSGNIRDTPWDLYELAQVHLSRSWKKWNEENAAGDRAQYISLLKKYADYYESNNWIRNKKKYKMEEGWYKTAKDEIAKNPT